MPRSKKLNSGKESEGEGSSLRGEVREALRLIITDKTASAAAKASAARTLMEFFGSDGDGKSASGRRATEMTADELDAEIARLTRRGS